MNKKTLFSIIIIFIIFILIYGIILLTNRVELNLKDSSKDIIYDKYNSNNKHVPYVNLVGGDIDKINDNISLFVKDYVNDNNSSISYNYNKTGNILSLVICIIDTKSIDVPLVKFTSYNILLNNSTLVSDDELFNLVNSNRENTMIEIENSFIDYYNSSDISKCIKYDKYYDYQKYYFDYDKDISYYLDNGKLYGYLNMNSGVDYSEYSYYLDKDFRVLVGDINAK